MEKDLRDTLEVVAVELHFLRMAIMAGDPRSWLADECVDIRKKCLDAIGQQAVPEAEVK
jgi:hypothetical protein